MLPKKPANWTHPSQEVSKQFSTLFDNFREAPISGPFWVALKSELELLTSKKTARKVGTKSRQRQPKVAGRFAFPGARNPSISRFGKSFQQISRILPSVFGNPPTEPGNSHSLLESLIKIHSERSSGEWGASWEWGVFLGSGGKPRKSREFPETDSLPRP